MVNNKGLIKTRPLYNIW